MIQVRMGDQHMMNLRQPQSAKQHMRKTVHGKIDQDMVVHTGRSPGTQIPAAQFAGLHARFAFTEDRRHPSEAPVP